MFKTCLTLFYCLLIFCFPNINVKSCCSVSDNSASVESCCCDSNEENALIQDNVSKQHIDYNNQYVDESSFNNDIKNNKVTLTSEKCGCKINAKILLGISFTKIHVKPNFKWTSYKLVLRINDTPINHLNRQFLANLPPPKLKGMGFEHTYLYKNSFLI